jgi:hypothetical protein
MLGFTTNSVNAQAVSTKEYIFTTDGRLGCMEEYASGEVIVHVVQDGHKRFVRNSGKLIGEETGNVYSFTYDIDHKDIFNKNNSQTAQSFFFIILVHCNGKPIGRLIGKLHIAFNANGELIVFNQDLTDWECI